MTEEEVKQIKTLEAKGTLEGKDAGAENMDKAAKVRQPFARFHEKARGAVPHKHNSVRLCIRQPHPDPSSAPRWEWLARSPPRGKSQAHQL